MKIESQLIGWEEVQKVLERMPERLEKTTLKKAITKAAVLVEQEAKATDKFKDRTGKLRQSIQVIDKVKRQAGVVRALVQAKAKHAHLVENGHFVKTKNGKRFIPGTFFMLDAFSRKKDEVVEIIKSEIKPAVDRFVRRELKAQKKAAAEKK
jgi:hypothetical protein